MSRLEAVGDHVKGLGHGALASPVVTHSCPADQLECQPPARLQQPNIKYRLRQDKTLLTKTRQLADLAYFTEGDTLYGAFQRTIMSEVTFAKGFLSTLDKRPIKLPADHVSDPKQYPNQSPVRYSHVELNRTYTRLTTYIVHPAPSNPPIPTPRTSLSRPGRKTHHRDCHSQAYAWRRGSQHPRPRS